MWAPRSCSHCTRRGSGSTEMCCSSLSAHRPPPLHRQARPQRHHHRLFPLPSIRVRRGYFQIHRSRRRLLLRRRASAEKPGDCCTELRRFLLLPRRPSSAVRIVRRPGHLFRTNLPRSAAYLSAQKSPKRTAPPLFGPSAPRPTLQSRRRSGPSLPFCMPPTRLGQELTERDTLQSGGRIDCPQRSLGH